MSSTRSKNTIGNYNLEQRQYKETFWYSSYKNSQYGEAYTTNFAGNGLNPGNIPGNKLSNNSSEIESFLFGINSTNLVTPAPNLTPDIVEIESVNLYEKQTIFMPEPLYVQKYQRPNLLN